MAKYHRKRFLSKTYADIINRQDGLCACGCKEPFTDVTKIEFDHHIPLWCDGKDEPGNLRAVIKNHHLEITKEQAKARAKMKRLERRGGGKRLNQRDKAIARMTGLEVKA